MKPLHFALHVGIAFTAPVVAVEAAPLALLPALAFATALVYHTLEQSKMDDAERRMLLAREALALERMRAQICPPGAASSPLTPDTLAVLELMRRLGPRRRDLVPVGTRYLLPSGEPLTRTRFEHAVATLKSAGLYPTS